jgi:hypothetical protein
MIGRSFHSEFAKYWGFDPAHCCALSIRSERTLRLLARRLAQAVSAVVSRHSPARPRRRGPALCRRPRLDLYPVFRRQFFHWAMVGSALGTPPRPSPSVAPRRFIERLTRAVYSFDLRPSTCLYNSSPKGVSHASFSSNPALSRVRWIRMCAVAAGPG